MLTKSPACMLLQPTCQATAGLSLHKALTANRSPQRSCFARLAVLARPSARPIRPVLSSATSDVVTRASGEDDDDDDDWDLRQEFGEPELMAEDEAFGPPAVVLAGFFLEELAAVRILLDEAGGESISVIASTPSLLRAPVGAAILTPEPRWDEPMPPDWVPGGGWGMQRTVLFSGLGLEAQGAVLELMATSKIGSVVPAVATPGNAGRLLGEVLAEAFKAYRTAPEGSGLGGGEQFVDELPHVRDVAASGGQRPSQPSQPEQPMTAAAAAAAAAERQQEATAQQAQQQETRSPSNGVTQVEAEPAGREGEGSAFGGEGDEGDFPWGPGGPEAAASGANPKSLDELLEELGGGWQLVDVQEELVPEGSEAAEWQGATAAASTQQAAPAQQAAEAQRSSAGSDCDRSGSGSGISSGNGISAQGYQQQRLRQGEVDGAGSGSREGSGPAASAASAAAARPVEADWVVTPGEAPLQQQQGEQQGQGQQGGGASGRAAAEQDGIDDPRWARFASEILDVQSWVVPDLGAPQQAQQEQPFAAGGFMQSGRARRGAAGAAGRSAAVEGRAAGGRGEIDSDEGLLDVIDRLAAGEPLDKAPLPGVMPARAPGSAPMATPTQQQPQQSQQQPGGAVSPGQVFATRSRQQQERQQAAPSVPAQQARAPSRGFGNKAGAQPIARLSARRVPASMRSIAASRLAAPSGNMAASGASTAVEPQVAGVAAQRRSPGSAAASNSGGGPVEQGPAGEEVLPPTPTAPQVQPRAAASAASAGGNDAAAGEAASGAASPASSDGGSSPAAGSEGGSSPAAGSEEQASGSNTSSGEAGSSSVIGAGSGSNMEAAGAGSGSSGTGSSSSVDDSEDEEMMREYTRAMTKGISTDASKGAAPGVTTMTKAELRAVAEKHGLSFEQLLADAQARGIELPD